MGLIAKINFSHFVQYSEGLKSYLRYKTISCNKVALDVQLMSFLFEKKKQCLEISSFCVFVKCKDLKICDFITSIAK